MRSLSQRFLLMFFSLVLALSSAAFAQSATQGNIIKKITLAQQGAENILTIDGLFDANQMAKLEIKKKPKATTFSISLPNSLIDPEGITTPFLTFAQGLFLENTQVVENIQEGQGGAVNFMVDLNIQARKDVRVSLVGPPTATRIQIRLQDVEAILAQADEAREKAKDQQAADAKDRQGAFIKKSDAELEAQKAAAMQKAQTQVNEILKQYQKPAVLQVSILNASGIKKRAYKLSVFLGNLEKRGIEESLGAKVDIVNISDSLDTPHRETTIYYRDNFLKAALFLAELIPGEQRVVAMQNQNERMGVDLEIYLGQDYK